MIRGLLELRDCYRAVPFGGVANWTLASNCTSRHVPSRDDYFAQSPVRRARRTSWVLSPSTTESTVMV